MKKVMFKKMIDPVVEDDDAVSATGVLAVVASAAEMAVLLSAAGAMLSVVMPVVPSHPPMQPARKISALGTWSTVIL